MKLLARITILPVTILLVLMSIRHMTISAEFDLEWSVTIYDHGWNALVELSSSGSQVTYLPDIGISIAGPENYLSAELTDDHQYLVSIVQREDPFNRKAVITNLESLEVTQVAAPILPVHESLIDFLPGAFNPEMTHVALPYVSITSGTLRYTGGIVAVDLATGQVEERIDIYGRYGENTATVDRWTDEGIWFTPRCYACTSDYIYNYELWNPDTNTVSTTHVFNHRFQAERLPTTGEVIFSETHPDYPLGASDFPLQLNTVTYYPANAFRPTELGQVVYYDPDNLDFDLGAHWVLNGQAFLVTNEQLHNVVVWRDGRQLTVDYATPQIFLAMTSDGWLTLDHDSNAIRHYFVDDGEIDNRILYHTSGYIKVANIHLPPIPYELRPFDIDISPPQDIVFCPGTLPTRLQPGDWAEVIVDHQEYPIASMLVGDTAFTPSSSVDQIMLPIHARVLVLEGPACTYLAGYVKVDFEGTIGWILEVYQTGYYLAPTSPP